jgi:hypothetical protein
VFEKMFQIVYACYFLGNILVVVLVFLQRQDTQGKIPFDEQSKSSLWIYWSRMDGEAIINSAFEFSMLCALHFPIFMFFLWP